MADSSNQPRRSLLCKPAHVGKETCKFQFNITIHRIHGLGKGVFAIKWTRGKKLATTNPFDSPGKLSNVTEIGEQLSLPVSLYRANSSSGGGYFVFKDTKISVLSYDKDGKTQKTIAKIHFDLAQYGNCLSQTELVTFKLNHKVSIDLEVNALFLGNGDYAESSVADSSVSSLRSLRESVDSFDLHTEQEGGPFHDFSSPVSIGNSTDRKSFSKHKSSSTRKQKKYSREETKPSSASRKVQRAPEHNSPLAKCESETNSQTASTSSRQRNKPILLPSRRTIPKDRSLSSPQKSSKARLAISEIKTSTSTAATERRIINKTPTLTDPQQLYCIKALEQKLPKENEKLSSEAKARKRTEKRSSAATGDSLSLRRKLYTTQNQDQKAEKVYKEPSLPHMLLEERTTEGNAKLENEASHSHNMASAGTKKNDFALENADAGGNPLIKKEDLRPVKRIGADGKNHSSLVQPVDMSDEKTIPTTGISQNLKRSSQCQKKKRVYKEQPISPMMRKENSTVGDAILKNKASHSRSRAVVGMRKNNRCSENVHVGGSNSIKQGEIRSAKSIGANEKHHVSRIATLDKSDDKTISVDGASQYFNQSKQCQKEQRIYREQPVSLMLLGKKTALENAILNNEAPNPQGRAPLGTKKNNHCADLENLDVEGNYSIKEGETRPTNSIVTDYKNHILSITTRDKSDDKTISVDRTSQNFNRSNQCEKEQRIYREQSISHMLFGEKTTLDNITLNNEAPHSHSRAPIDMEKKNTDLGNIDADGNYPIKQGDIRTAQSIGVHDKNHSSSDQISDKSDDKTIPVDEASQNLERSNQQLETKVKELLQKGISDKEKIDSLHREATVLQEMYRQTVEEFELSKSMSQYTPGCKATDHTNSEMLLQDDESQDIEIKQTEIGTALSAEANGLAKGLKDTIQQLRADLGAAKDREKEYKTEIEKLVIVAQQLRPDLGAAKDREKEYKTEIEKLVIVVQELSLQICSLQESKQEEQDDNSHAQSVLQNMCRNAELSVEFMRSETKAYQSLMFSLRSLIDTMYASSWDAIQRKSLTISALRKMKMEKQDAAKSISERNTALEKELSSKQNLSTFLSAQLRVLETENTILRQQAQRDVLLEKDRAQEPERNTSDASVARKTYSDFANLKAICVQLSQALKGMHASSEKEYVHLRNQVTGNKRLRQNTKQIISSLEKEQAEQWASFKCLENDLQGTIDTVLDPSIIVWKAADELRTIEDLRVKAEGDLNRVVLHLATQREIFAEASISINGISDRLSDQGEQTKARTLNEGKQSEIFFNPKVFMNGMNLTPSEKVKGYEKQLSTAQTWVLNHEKKIIQLSTILHSISQYITHAFEFLQRSVLIEELLDNETQRLINEGNNQTENMKQLINQQNEEIQRLQLLIAGALVEYQDSDMERDSCDEKVEATQELSRKELNPKGKSSKDDLRKEIYRMKAECAILSGTVVSKRLQLATVSRTMMGIQVALEADQSRTKVELDTARSLEAQYRCDVSRTANVVNQVSAAVTTLLDECSQLQTCHNTSSDAKIYIYPLQGKKAEGEFNIEDLDGQMNMFIDELHNMNENKGPTIEKRMSTTTGISTFAGMGSSMESSMDSRLMTALTAAKEQIRILHEEYLSVEHALLRIAYGEHGALKESKR